MGWDSSKYTVLKMAEAKQLVHLKVRKIDGNFTFLWSIVYASNCQYKRQVLWNDLRAVIPNREAWLVSGDFNNVLFSYERRGGEIVHPRETIPIADCIVVTGLVDLKSSGCLYTWNKGGASNRVW